MKCAIGEAVLVAVLGVAAGMGANVLRKDGIPLHADPRSLIVGEGITLLGLDSARGAFEEGAVFIDARARERFVRGHIEGAISLPPNSYEESYRKWWEFIPSDETVVVYAGAREPRLAGARAQWLMEREHRRVVVFFDGWEAWEHAGLPQSTGED